MTTTSVTNSDQYDYLVEWMSKHLEIAKGLITREQCRGEVKLELCELVEELNALGPPHKRLYQWRKVWTSFRYLIKTKLRQKFFNGHRHKFNKRQLRVIEFLDLEKVVREEYLQSTTMGNKKDEILNHEPDDDSNNDVADDAEELNDIKPNANDLESTDIFTEILQEQDIIENSNTKAIKKSLLTKEVSKLMRLQVLLQRQQLGEQQILLNVARKVENQLSALNESEENNEFLLEESNKHLQTLLYRRTSHKEIKKQNTHEIN